MAIKRPQPCERANEADAYTAFANAGKTESARHIKPLHWYVACRLVIEGGFDPDNIKPRPPFSVEVKRSKGGKNRYMLIYDSKLGGTGEQVILGGLKTKNVDVVVNLPQLGPVPAVSCKGVTKSFRNLTNRMEETIGECTNLHITYPAMVIGYYALLRANRTAADAAEAPELDDEDSISSEPTEDELTEMREAEFIADIEPDGAVLSLTANDVAINRDGQVVEGIVRFHDASKEMTGRRGIRDEISRYESMTVVLVEPKGTVAGTAFADFPEVASPLNAATFFQTLYQRYEERFVYGAPLLAERGVTRRFAWDPESPAFADPIFKNMPYKPR